MKKTSNPDFALQQIKRLRSKPFYPVADIDSGRTVNHGERELVRTLVTYSDSEDHMRRVIDAAVIRAFGPDGQDRCPSTSDLWSLCREVNPAPPESAAVVNFNCEHCFGLGWLIVSREPGITGALRCPSGCLPTGGYAASPLSSKAVFRIYMADFKAGEQRRAQRLSVTTTA